MCFYEPYKPTRNVGIIQPPGAGFSVQPVLVQQYSIPDSGNTFIPETEIVAVQFYQQFYLLQSGDFHTGAIPKPIRIVAKVAVTVADFCKEILHLR